MTVEKLVVVGFGSGDLLLVEMRWGGVLVCGASLSVMCVMVLHLERGENVSLYTVHTKICACDV